MNQRPQPRAYHRNHRILYRVWRSSRLGVFTLVLIYAKIDWAG